jgi:hypothetical protein
MAARDSRKPPGRGAWAGGQSRVSGTSGSWRVQGGRAREHDLTHQHLGPSAEQKQRSDSHGTSHDPGGLQARGSQCAEASPDANAECDGSAEGWTGMNGGPAGLGSGRAQGTPPPARPLRVLPGGRPAAHRWHDRTPPGAGTVPSRHHAGAGVHHMARPATHLRQPPRHEGRSAQGHPGVDGPRDHRDDHALRPLCAGGPGERGAAARPACAPSTPHRPEMPEGHTEGTRGTGGKRKAQQPLEIAGLHRLFPTGFEPV